MADLDFDDEPEVQLARLETDPSNSAVRPRRFTNGRWCVIAYDPEEDSAILGEPHPGREGDVAVRYLGPATFD